MSAYLYILVAMYPGVCMFVYKITYDIMLKQQMIELQKQYSACTYVCNPYLEWVFRPSCAAEQCYSTSKALGVWSGN